MVRMNEKPEQRRWHFGLRTLFEIVAVVAFILALLAYRRPQNDGRYQSSNFSGAMWVLDTETGDLWQISSNGIWMPKPKHRT